MARQHLGQRALARAVGPHDRVHLAGVHRQIDALEDLLVAGAMRTEALNFQHRAHPDTPFQLTPSSFCASTANSIGSSLKTSLQKPFTIIEMAFSVLSPRCLQ